jgi:protein-S-isoprenylcysteine O-methyltransferase Ste14
MEIFMIAILNFIVMIVAGIFMSILYVISVSPARLEQRIGKSAYKCCGLMRTLSMVFMFVVITNYVTYASYPLSLPIPASFPWNYWISFLIAIVITIPSLYLIIRGLIDAGTETAIPKKEHAMCGGIYEKIRHPQAVGELPLWFAISFFIHSLHMAIFSLVWIPVWYWWCIAEEKDLLLRYGDSYIDYIQSTGRFFPKRKYKTRTRYFNTHHGESRRR